MIGVGYSWNDVKIRVHIDFACSWANPGGIQRVGSREQFGILKDLTDVVVTGHHPKVRLLVMENGCRRASFGEERVGVGKVGTSEGIKTARNISNAWWNVRFHTKSKSKREYLGWLTLYRPRIETEWAFRPREIIR
jgi:hypothetical protein